jgi:hypothetical protein
MRCLTGQNLASGQGRMCGVTPSPPIWNSLQPIFSYSNSAVIVPPLNQWVAGELTIFRILDPPPSINVFVYASGFNQNFG